MPMNTLDQNAVVAELIDSDLRLWKRDIIFSVFNEFEAKYIVSIPISFRLLEDKIIWHGEKDGLYSIRSAYHQVGEEKRRAQAGSLSSGSNRSMWKEIWHINLPNCVKNFLSRLAKGILPSSN